MEKILIVEDDALLVRFLELELIHEGYGVEVLNHGHEAVEKVKQGSFGLVLLDVMLPGLGGMEICRRIRRFSDIPIIMLTARGEVMDKVMGLDTGADDYVTKPFAIEELLARIRAVLRNRRGTSSPEETLQISDLKVDLKRFEVSRGNCNIKLSKQELQLLSFMMQNQGIVLSREVLLEKVWGYDFQGDSNVVDVYIRYLRSKIDDPYEKRLIQTVRGVGYTIKE